ncbi:MAG: Ni/Fe hydrogenase subunit alpha [Deltaproteobacteria bacterium]|nr:Ni/Fe hydrogenase subunit alpha [Deltaproteobacteria bacterium]
MSNGNLNIDIHYVTRVEGHGNIVVNAKDGNVENVQWQGPEAPRYFEAMVIGQKWDMLHHITSRICGICSIGHTSASVKATENAMGLKLSDQSELLRRLAIHAENLQSHVLHVGYLVLPDLVGVGSVIPLATSHPNEVKTVIKLHRIANQMSDLVCGRTIHPQRIIPGGFSKVPTIDELKGLKDTLLSAAPDLTAVGNLLKALAPKLPNFTRETEYVSLTDKNEYALYDGLLGSSLGDTAPITEYETWTNEFCVPQSTAKYTKRKQDSLMVGALARFNINHAQLTPNAKKYAEEIGLVAPCYNTFMNTVAQFVECIYMVDDSVRIIDELLHRGIKEETVEVKPKAGRGIGVVDVPRGILIHDYTYDDDGVCTKANCIIPTNQNHNNIQRDMEALVPQIVNKPQAEVELLLEMLVRAYDPCISCSTHYLKVNFNNK